MGTVTAFPTPKARKFDFDRPVEHWQAIAAIDAALADEGLALSTANTPDRPKGFVLTASTYRVIVPASRIVAR